MDVARIAVKRYTEFGNDTEKIHSEIYKSRVSYYCRRFVAGEQSFATQIRACHSSQKVSRPFKTFAGRF